MKACRYILVACFCLFPLIATASTCNVDPSGEFKISFNINSAQLVESVFAEQEPGNNRPEYTIWTNDINEPTVGDTPFIRDPRYMVGGGDYSVQLIYQPGAGNDAGTADYYVDDGQGFTFLGNYPADFKGIHPQSVDINSGDSTELECDSSDIEPPPVYSNDAQYEFGIVQCSGGECKIPLTQSYTNTPLVFVMPTIDSSAPDADAPATLMVTEVSKTEATIKQIKAPKNGGGSDLDSQPITEVSYLAIEPGVADFNGHEVIAGYLNTDAASAKSGSNSNDRVLYSDFGGAGFSSNPVVLHQIQTRNNNDKWMTSGKVRRTDETSYIDLFLELSASHRSNDDYDDEKIAFLATLATNTNLDVDGFKVQFARGYDTPSQSGNDPMLDGCEDKYATTSLTNIDGIIANKQERAGGHGGWLRRCNINTNQVSFVVDEDFRDRTHIPEEVGYFAFELPEVVPVANVCNLFPEPIQSWTGVNSSLTVTSQQTKFSGWSNNYINQSLKKVSEGYELFNDKWTTKDDFLLLGFDDASEFYHIYNFPVCDEHQCDVGNNDSQLELRKIKGSYVTSIAEKNPSESLTITGKASDILQSCGADSEICSYQINGETIDVFIESNLSKLVINKQGNDYNLVRVVLDEDSYISDVKVSGGAGVELVFPDNSTVTFDNYEHDAGDLVYAFEGNSQINVITRMKFNLAVDIQSDFAYPIIYAPKGEVIFDVGNSTFKGFILADTVDLNQTAIHGAVTARVAVLDNGVTIIKPDYSCEPPVQQGLLIVEPQQLYSLTCERIPVEFRLEENGELVDSNEQFEATVTPTGTRWCTGEANNACETPDYTFDGGIRTLYLDSDTVGSFSVGGVYDSEPATSTQVFYVPYKFDTSPSQIHMNAAQDSQELVVEVTAQACDQGVVSPVNGYTKNLSFDASKDYFLEMPTPEDGSLDDFSVTDLNFDNGGATTEVNWSNVGQVNVVINDPSFDCSEIEGCPIYEQPDSASSGLVGSFVVKSKPYEFAVCTDSDSSGTSTESSSSGFVAAGESFDVDVKPMITGANVNSVCSNNVGVPSNYFVSQASISVSHYLDTPSEGVLGYLMPDTISPSISISDQSNGGYQLDGLTYSEVGSFELVAIETGNFYSTIAPPNGDSGVTGSKTIGRFYPKYFIQGSPEWNVANQNDIAYLSQPYDSTVHQVYPMASGESDTDNALNNYRFFSSDLQASFGILDDASVDNGFLLDTGAGTWSADRKHWLLNDSAAVLQRVTDSDDVSRRDAPFNTSDANSTITHFGLTVAGVDPVSFTDSDILTDSVEFPVQPPARYGRMVLDDIGGNSDTTLTIPLRAEFWDGSEFIVNEDDDRSTFNGANTCKQVIWHSEGAATTLVSLNGSGNVDDGEEEVTANQNTPAGTDAPREQVRLWLRMDDSEPNTRTGENPITCSGSDQEQPWLRYNWRQLGDEDPSTVVTFGIYRGNDRVIYRGESGLTGQ
ncbi:MULTISPECIES: DUF6701 domain-containing protein [unclassified Vibrio]|uniref:DUF6701 domain-containing protein n=1 Tax=unclassified Vibrio TaxID=2614977 RepID=UPI00354B6708